jgi:spermidine/putrescine transport system substrate-binding protein
MIEPFDTSRMPNWKDVSFGDAEGFTVDGQVYVVPVDWGSTGLTYRTDKVSEADAATLQSFANPKYKGRISLPDNVDDAYALGYLALGITDWNKGTDEDFKAASAFLRKVHANVRTYWADGAELSQLMSSGEVLISWAWSETPVTMQAEGHPVKMNLKTKEGSSTWVCGYVNLTDGPGSEDKMYDFINAWLEPRSAEYIVTEWGYGHSNLKAMAALGQETLDGVGFSNFETYTDGTLQQTPLPFELREKMIAEFEKIKAGF